jgi:hypothetical protein
MLRSGKLVPFVVDILRGSHEARSDLYQIGGIQFFYI